MDRVGSLEKNCFSNGEDGFRGVILTTREGIRCVTYVVSIKCGHGWTAWISCLLVNCKEALSYSEEINTLWAWVECRCY